jgi:hypothetical protein
MADRGKGSRREFLKLATATTLAASSKVHFLEAQDVPGGAPAGRVGLATIGLGIQGFGDTSISSRPCTRSPARSAPRGS